LKPPFISMILPTRGRVSSLQRFLKSIILHTDQPHQLEIILVIDKDDRESIEFEFPDLLIKKRIVRPGQSMGSLNQAGFEVSSGRYLMLVNDDVVIQTDHWDNKLRSVLDKYTDSVILAHVNDLIFHHVLCSFPIVSREYCEIAKGICPIGFNKYNIDDHIFATFRITAALGASRIIFFPFIIFNHLNYVMQSGRRTYSINPEIKAQDEILFHKLHEERLSVAVELCRRTGLAPSIKRILKLKRDRNASRVAPWPSKVYLGLPKWQEFNLVMNSAIRQISLKELIRHIADKNSL
jgi:glycosyltransferase involved in cell wall biosynthesis